MIKKMSRGFIAHSVKTQAMGQMRGTMQRHISLNRLNSTASKNLHRPDSAGSSDAAEAADAAATVLADKNDLQKLPNKATWLQALREREKQLAAGKVLDSYSYKTPVTTEVSDRSRSDSFSYLTLPFKDDKWLCDAYINANGRLRAGQLFQDLDALAGRIGYRHCSPAEPVNVTASVDRIYMVKKVDEIYKFNFVLAGYVTWTGKSSMEICVKGYAFEGKLPSSITEDTLPEENVFLSANFTFVARNPSTHKSFTINRLLPRNEKEWIDYKRAESRNAKKKLAAKMQHHVQPSDEENRLIYDMWRSSKNYESKGISVKHASFVNDTRMNSTLFMQPQYRNRHSYMIFGGYLLRQSFELAYCAGAAFAGAGPRFVSLDSTTFKAPVPVGSVLSMTASISYTEHLRKDESKLDDSSPFDFILPSTNKISSNPDAFLSEPGTLVQVRVDTSIKPLDSTEAKESGTFIYSFFVPKSSYPEGDAGFCSIIPQTYSEMMEYIEGRRRAQDTAIFSSTLPKAKL
ncbi:Piso0_005183 [Millerozyma farinosa CBS 7064]|uniref:Piso0_005183 protein n=1 Tax=Pichia sorbitophila (strain ATCC MYA-4447 / BCRC 22081 / CBS 7064 / NBRC 10061 / NRRL Y-12695) TaxID=559304 RepID=G8Y4F7_PICSO|nr:Piso0_005183 [Millerozyma farinosa CBS 7064]